MNLIKIHEDKRGYVYTIEDEHLGYPEMTFFFTRKGFARGGCIHTEHDEHFSVVSGDLLFYCGDDIQRLSSGMSYLTPKNTPHYLIAKEDCMVIEWGANKEEKGVKDPKFREIVNNINDKSD